MSRKDGGVMLEQNAAALALQAAIGRGEGLLKRLLDTLPTDVTTALLSHAKVRELAAGEVVIERGARSQHIGYVLDGTLAMLQDLEDGKRHILGLLVPTDVLGRVFNGPSGYRIETLSPARILCLDRAPFEQVLRENPAAERLFLVHLLDEVDAAREWLLLISGRKVTNRLASFLTILARRSGLMCDGKPDVIHVPLARKDLAQYLGARPETLSRALHKLERKGVLRILDPYHLEILDDEALLVASGDDLIMQD